MTSTDIYQEIAQRTGGDVYIGVVGPVRTGKSTFIKRFMETMVIPGIEDVYRRERARDELPQSGSGRTIMTAEPKFVPEEAAEISLPDGAKCRVRLIDCVGYLVDGAIGTDENGEERMVTTPWFPEEIPMRRAAEEGTKKVIAEHSTVGIVVTTDGTVTDLPRESYEDAEKRVVSELQTIGKPFAVVVNSAQPDSPEAQRLRASLEDRYGVDCICTDCMQLEEDGIAGILKCVLDAFPLREIGVRLPTWVDALPNTHELKRMLYAGLLEGAQNAHAVRDVSDAVSAFAGLEGVSEACVKNVDMGTGTATVEIRLPEETFYSVLSGESGFEIRDEGDLMRLLSGFAALKERCERVSEAMEEVRTGGYGILYPTKEELKLEEPVIVRNGGRYGVKLKARAPSVHMIAVNVETEVSPGIGGERVSEDLVSFLLQDFEGDAGKIWDSNVFGKPLDDLAGESINTKIRRFPEDAREKFRGTLERVVNEGSKGLICILI